MRGQLQDWNCRAGQNSLIIRTDGTLAPCFPLYSATCDWGTAGKPNFDSRQLCQIKGECQPHCFSTLNHTLAYCYDAGRVIRWLLKQARNGFRGRQAVSRTDGRRWVRQMPTAIADCGTLPLSFGTYFSSAVPEMHRHECVALPPFGTLLCSSSFAGMRPSWRQEARSDEPLGVQLVRTC